MPVAGELRLIGHPRADEPGTPTAKSGYLNGVQGVPSSNLGAPTTRQPDEFEGHRNRWPSFLRNPCPSPLGRNLGDHQDRRPLVPDGDRSPASAILTKPNSLLSPPTDPVPRVPCSTTAWPDVRAGSSCPITPLATPCPPYREHQTTVDVTATCSILMILVTIRLNIYKMNKGSLLRNRYINGVQYPLYRGFIYDSAMV